MSGWVSIKMAQGRMFVNTEPALPRRCSVCYRDSNGTLRFLDFNESIDFYGAILICENCVNEATAVMGNFVPVAKLDHVEGNLVVATELLIAEKAKVEALEQLVTAYGINQRSGLAALGITDRDLLDELAESGSPEAGDPHRV